MATLVFPQASDQRKTLHRFARSNRTTDTRTTLKIPYNGIGNTGGAALFTVVNLVRPGPTAKVLPPRQGVYCPPLWQRRHNWLIWPHLSPIYYYPIENNVFYAW